MDGGVWWAAVHGVAGVGHNWATSLSLVTFMHWRRNGNPLQCYCLENPRDGGACWAAISGVAQSRTQLKWLSSSSSKELWCSRTQRLGFQHWVTGFDLGQVDFPSGFQFPHLKNVGVGFSPLHYVVLEVGGLYNWHSNLHGLVKHFGMSFQCCSWELV